MKNSTEEQDNRDYIKAELLRERRGERESYSRERRAEEEQTGKRRGEWSRGRGSRVLLNQLINQENAVGFYWNMRTQMAGF